MSYAPFSFADLVQQVSLTGLYNGHVAKIFQIMGRRAGFTSLTVLNDVKEFDNAAAAIPIFTSADALEIISSSVNDDGAPAGTGVQTVKVTYINASNALVESANITLNGTTAVAAGFVANEIICMEATAVGSGLVAAGNIRLRIVAGPVEIEQISLGSTKSMSARFMVPTGYKGYMIHWDGSAVNNDQDMRLLATVTTLNRTLLPGVYIQHDLIYIPLNTVADAQQAFLVYPALSRIKVATLSGGTAGSVRAASSFGIVIIADA